MELLDCPLCDFTVLPTDDYVLQLHFEQVHTEDSPFVIKDDPEPLPPLLGSSSKRKHVRDTTSSDEEENTVACPEPDCGEVVLLDDFNDHLDLHTAETLSFDENTGKYRSHHSSGSMHNSAATHHSHRRSSKTATSDYRYDTESLDGSKSGESHGKAKRKHHRDRRGTDSSEKSTLARSILSFNPFTKEKSVKPPSKSARLGKSELGPYAWEDRMPKWLLEQLAAGPKISVVNRIGRDGRLIKQEQVQNETPGVIPILAQLSALDRTVKEAYYCHPSTLHVGKTPKEGSFCGYRNIQMLISYIQGSKAQGHEEFSGRLPGILKLQEIIERAWDKGINHIGRVQTGGIQDTRKYIGTPEAQALFLSTEIDCAVEMFSDQDTPHGKVQAHDLLLLAVERYFARAAVDDGSSVHKTLLPPIYLQRPGHSLTIVGFERRSDSYCNLVVLDPVYATSPAMHKLIGRKNIKSARPEVMHAYRRGPAHLRKFAAFEILILTATPPLFPAWDVLRQFPDCSFVYAFFRARTLGYDVYPEDYFLRNFPWQQYGGLWIVDEARFTRAEHIDPLTAQSLRCITGGGASSLSNDISNPISQLTNGLLQHQPVMLADPQSNTWSQHSAIPALDGTFGDPIEAVPSRISQPLLKTGSFPDALPQPEIVRPSLALLTDVGRRYPGFPTPLSPTLSARELYPTPISESGSGCAISRVQSPAVRSVSPMSLDGSNMCGPSTRCFSHSYEHFAGQMNNIDSILTRSNSGYHAQSPLHIPSTSCCSPACPTSPESPTSPARVLSPRAGMLRSMAAKQILRGGPHSPLATSEYTSIMSFGDHKGFASSSGSRSESVLSPYQAAPPIFSSIQIANGTEFETGSPISPSGTMLSYTSNRAVDSGLLAIPALSEPQVAEYRFWVPCGRWACAFGCGGAHEGESAAAKRLFRGEQDVVVDEQVEGECHEYVGKEAGPKGKPIGEWERFLMHRYRDVSVAKV